MKTCRIVEKLKEKRGGSTLLEIIVSLGLISFILFYPIATYSLINKENLLEDVLAIGIQSAAIEGGLTNKVEDIIYLNMEQKGLIPKDSHDDQETRKKIEISSNADARGGSLENLIYRDDSDSKIYIEILYPAKNEVRLINGLSKIIGAGQGTVPFSNQNGVEWRYKHKGYILSEKIDF